MSDSTSRTAGGEVIYNVTQDKEIDNLYKHAQLLDEAGANAGKVRQYTDHIYIC
jgi:hypothetical protein